MAYKTVDVHGPFKGVVDSIPDPFSPPESFRDVLNFICRKGRVQTRPRRNPFVAPPDNAIVRLMVTFTDVIGNLHTLVLTTKNAYYLTLGGTYVQLNYPGGYANLAGTSLPYAWIYINGRIYFCNGTTKILYCDGEIDLKIAGDVQGAARFMGINASHLILGWTSEPEPAVTLSRDFPQRIRWCKSGDPNDWTSFSSGFNDLLEVPDELTGIASLGRNTFLFRTNGISVMYPTGLGLSPFRFEQYSYAPQGVGNVYPYSLAVYGNQAVFIAADDIYSMDGSNLRPIGGNVKKRIFNDLQAAAGDVLSGFITARMGVGYDFLSYWLSIPGVNVTWVYHYDEDNWVRDESIAGRITAMNTVATV